MKNFNTLILFFLLSFVLVNCQNKKIAVAPSSNSLQSIYFDYDQAVIQSAAMGAMQGNASYLKSHPDTTVTIEGNCDSRGTNEYNLALGQRRAEATKNYIINLGISSSRLRTVSYGEEKPVCSQSSESCWQRNRRADFRR